MTLYHFLLFGHIVGSILWLGSAFLLEALGWRAALTKNQYAMYEVGAMSEWLSKRIIMPSGLATILFGFALVIFGKPTFSSLWVIIAIVGIFLSGVIGGGFISKTSKALVAAMKKKKNEKTIEKLYRRLTFFSRIETAILFIILFDMVMKPKAEDISFFVISGIFFLAVFFLSFREYQRI